MGGKKMKREFNLAGLFILGCSFYLYSANVPVTTNADSGSGSLRAAIEQINAGSDGSNTINMQIPGNSPISLSSDLPVIKQNTVINSNGKQPIDGQGQYRLFATIMADLTINNCTLQNGAAIGGDGGGGGMGAGGAVYIDRGNTLTLITTNINGCKAQGGKGYGRRDIGGGGASFSTASKSSSTKDGGGDYPGLYFGNGASYDGSLFLVGYGGGDGGEDLRLAKGDNKRGFGGGDGTGDDGVKSKGGNGGYCGGGGGCSGSNASGGGGNGGGSASIIEFNSHGGGGGFGSGGGSTGAQGGGGGGFGGGGGNARGSPAAAGGGGFGGGSGGSFSTSSSTVAQGGRFGGSSTSLEKGAGGGAGLGGAIFVGDTAICIIRDNIFISKNKVLGGEGSNYENKGQGYAPDIFLFREAKVIFNNTGPLNAPYSIMADQKAPEGHLDSGIIKQGPGQLTLSNTNNNYRGGTSIEGGTLSVTDPKALGSQTAPITLNGGNLQPTKTMTLNQPIVASGTGNIDTPNGTTLTTTGNISGSGTLNKTNAGTWKQTGISTHIGEINIQQGILRVDGTLPSNINVQQKGILAGTGTARGNVTNNGIVKPGDNNIGTLTIDGNYVQTPDGTLFVQLKPDGTSDKLKVNGGAQLDGTLYVNLEPGIYPRNKDYHLIEGGALLGNFNRFTSNANGAITTENDFTDYRLTLVDPEIILPIPNNQLPNNQKQIANYLFCANFPFENDRLVNLLNNLFRLPLNSYIKALATLTPEHYGALPTGESRTIHYLLTQNIPTCTPDCPTTKHTLIATPLYFRNDIHQHKSIPNYVQNSGGFRVNYAIAYPTPFQPKASISYIHTHTHWGNHRGKADSNGVYLDVGIGYSMKGFLASLALLGGYSYTDATHNLNIGYPIKSTSTPHSWDLSESLSLQYTHIYRCIAIIPRIVLTQTNVYLSSICENKPKSLNLQTDAKYFGFFDTLISLRMQAQKSHCYCCVKPYVDLGWHNSFHLSNTEFHSKLDNYTACACSFSTKTYSGSTNRFFMEWGIAFSFMSNVDLLLNSRTEMTKGDFIQAVNLGASWRF